MLAVSLASGVALYAHHFCTARGIPDQGLTVRLNYETARQPARIAALQVAVQLPEGFPAQYRGALERAVRACPVHNTLAHGPVVEVILEEAALAV
jgi:putative redox protein